MNSIRQGAFPGSDPAPVVGQWRRGFEIRLDVRMRPRRIYDPGYFVTGQLITTFGVEERIVQVRARLESPEDFRNLIVARRGGRAVTLDQVADIEDGQQEEETAALVNGRRALSIDVVKAQGENTIAVVDGIHQGLLQTQSQVLPPIGGDLPQQHLQHRPQKQGRRKADNLPAQTLRNQDRIGQGEAWEDESILTAGRRRSPTSPAPAPGPASAAHAPELPPHG